MQNQTDGINQANWPLPKFSFQVEWDDHILSFQDITGLDSEAKPVAFSSDEDPRFSNVQTPVLNKGNEVTMNKGTFVSENNFWGWYDRMRIHRATTDIVITLIDNNGSPTMSWTLINSWPKQITAKDITDTENEVAIESIIFVYEGLTIHKP